MIAFARQPDADPSAAGNRDWVSTSRPSTPVQIFWRPIDQPAQSHASCACGGDCPRCKGKQRPAETLVQSALRSPARPLANNDRQFFSARLATDLSNVQVHEGSEAALAADALSATAFTVNNHIVFGAGQYAPHAPGGRRLLAHELTHVAQQASASGAGGPPIARQSNSLSADGGSLTLSQPDAAGEVEADRVAEAIDTPATLQIGRQAAGTIQRALRKGCIAPSLVVTPVVASQFGSVAETIIEADYISKKGGVPFREVFLDNPLGPISYVAFLASHHPSLNLALLATQIGLSGGVLIPDILDTRSFEFYEIKPDSFDGRPAGRAKLNAIDAFMSFNTLPYGRGVSYVPTPSIPIPLAGAALGATLGLPLLVACGVPNVTLQTVRSGSGLLLYEVCVEADLDCYLKVMALELLLALIIIAILIGRGIRVPIPVPAPIPAPVPVPVPALVPVVSEASGADAGVAGADQGAAVSNSESEE